MTKSNQTGFSAVEGLLVLILVAILGFTGAYVYHAQHSANKTLDVVANSKPSQATVTKKACELTQPVAYKGEVYQSPGEHGYSVCIPDGWQVYWTGDARGSGLTAIASGLHYTAGKPPLIAKTGGKDGAFPFASDFNTGSNISLPPPTDFTKVGSISASGVVAAKYTRTQTTEPVEDLGSVPKGTVQYEYQFLQANRSLDISYNIMPGDADNTSLVEAVVSSVLFRN